METGIESWNILRRLLTDEVKAKVTQSCPTLCNPIDYTVHGILQPRILEWVAFAFSRGSSQPRDRTQVSTLQVNFLPAEPPGKPKNTGVGTLSLLQGIFLTQESNQGLLYCRWILYQLSYRGSTDEGALAKRAVFPWVQGGVRPEELTWPPVQAPPCLPAHHHCFLAVRLPVLPPLPPASVILLSSLTQCFFSI